MDAEVILVVSRQDLRASLQGALQMGKVSLPIVEICIWDKN